MLTSNLYKIKVWLRTVIEGKEIYIIYKNDRAAEITYYLAINESE